MFFSLIDVSLPLLEKYPLSWLMWLSGLSALPVNQRVTSLIPSQGSCLGCGQAQ